MPRGSISATLRRASSSGDTCAVGSILMPSISNVGAPHSVGTSLISEPEKREIRRERVSVPVIDRAFPGRGGVRVGLAVPEPCLDTERGSSRRALQVERAAPRARARVACCQQRQHGVSSEQGTGIVRHDRASPVATVARGPTRGGIVTHAGHAAVLRQPEATCRQTRFSVFTGSRRLPSRRARRSRHPRWVPPARASGEGRPRSGRPRPPFLRRARAGVAQWLAVASSVPLPVQSFASTGPPSICARTSGIGGPP